MLEQNISEKNAFMRMICGVAMTAFGIGRIAHDSKCSVGRVMILAGAMKVAEGYYQYCPVTAMMKQDEEVTETESNTFS